LPARMLPLAWQLGLSHRLKRRYIRAQTKSGKGLPL